MLTELLGEWLACPECGSEDVTISLSFPTGTLRIQCDDCRRRDTVAEDGQITRGYPYDDHPASNRTSPVNNSNERFYAAVGAVMVANEHLPAAAEQRGVDPAAVHQTIARTRENDDQI